MTRKKAILYLLLLVLGFSAGYFLKPSVMTTPIKYLPSEKIEESKIPECFAGICPRYFSMTVDKDMGPGASVVVIPTAMTQGVGKIMIIKKGKVIFESLEMPNIWIESVEDGDGFILKYSSPRDENLNNVDYRVRYRYRDGQFIKDKGQ